MTEDEARKKWCPMACTPRHLEANAAADGMTEFNACIGSDCMMWRWELRLSVDAPTDGYCGLAGGP